MNIPHDSSCHEGSKNVSFIQVRNLEGQNHPGHTVSYVLVALKVKLPCLLISSYKDGISTQTQIFVVSKRIRKEDHMSLMSNIGKEEIPFQHWERMIYFRKEELPGKGFVM